MGKKAVQLPQGLDGLEKGLSGNAENPAGPEKKEQLRSPRLHLCG